VGENQKAYCPACLNSPIDMWTCWIPLSDLHGSDSRLQVIPGSHRSMGGYEHPSPQQNGTLLPSSFQAAERKGQVAWQTPRSIAMGDIILFNLKTVHRANSNSNKRSRAYRLSIDTRVTTCRPQVRQAAVDESALTKAMQSIQELLQRNSA